MSCKPLKSLQHSVMNPLNEKICPWWLKVGGIFGVASLSYYLGRWLGARSKLQKLRDDKGDDNKDADIEVVL